MFGAYKRDIEKVIEEVKRNVVLGIFPKLVDPPAPHSSVHVGIKM